MSTLEPVLTLIAALVALWAVWKIVKWALKFVLTGLIVAASVGYLWHQGYLDLFLARSSDPVAESPQSQQTHQTQQNPRH